MCGEYVYHQQARESVLHLGCSKGLLITRSLAGTNNLLQHTAERRHLRTNQRETCHAPRGLWASLDKDHKFAKGLADDCIRNHHYRLDLSYVLIIMILISRRTTTRFQKCRSELDQKLTLDTGHGVCLQSYPCICSVFWWQYSASQYISSPWSFLGPLSLFAAYLYDPQYNTLAAREVSWNLPWGWWEHRGTFYSWETYYLSQMSILV